ncbi:MAG: tetratricopeptide repeat protein [Phycisphaerae bacterium]
MLALSAVQAAAPLSAALRNVKVGDQVPDFAVKTLDGKGVTKAYCKGKVLLLLFVRPGQANSVEALIVAQRIAREYKDTKLTLLAVSTKPDAGDQLKAIVAEHGLRFGVALDPSRRMYGDYGLIVSPTTLLVDETGVLRYELPHMPPNFERRLRTHVDFLLGKIADEKHDMLLQRMKRNAPSTLSGDDRQFALAESLIKKRHFEQAATVLIKLKDKEDSARVANALGSCYLAMNRVDEAAKCLEAASDTGKVTPELKLALGRLEVRRGDDAKAEKHLLEGLKLAPDDGAINYELGRLYERQNRFEQAARCYRRVLDSTYDAGQ